MSKAGTAAPGRVPGEIGERIRQGIRSGRFPAGKLLPGLRSLSRKHRVALVTMQRAMSHLASQGLVAAEPRRGYRVLGGPADAEKSRPLAYVAALEGGPRRWNPLHQRLLAAFQEAAQARGWAMLGVGSEEREQAAVMRQVAGARAWGLILDVVDPGLLEMARASGLPAVMVDAWVEDAGIDAVVQDGYQGGLLAAAHLAACGHRRVAWLGPTTQSAHSLARLGGATVGLLRAGIELGPELRVEASGADIRDRARALLSRADRPTAVIALWQWAAAGLAAAARELGLVPGRDFELVGWCTEEEFLAEYRPAFAGGPVPPTLVWSIRAMAELAVSRLVERRANPGLLPVRINVPVALRVGDGRGR